MHFTEKPGVSVRKVNDELNLIYASSKCSLNTAFPQITACWNLDIDYIFMAFSFFPQYIFHFLYNNNKKKWIELSCRLWKPAQKAFRAQKCHYNHSR